MLIVVTEPINPAESSDCKDPKLVKLPVLLGVPLMPFSVSLPACMECDSGRSGFSRDAVVHHRATFRRRPSTVPSTARHRCAPSGVANSKKPC